MYVIINKVEFVDNNLLYTPVGYTLDYSIIIDINNNYESTLGQWLNQNAGSLTVGSVQLSDYGNHTTHIAKTYLVGSHQMLDTLTNITNLNQLV